MRRFYVEFTQAIEVDAENEEEAELKAWEMADGLTIVDCYTYVTGEV